VTLDIVGRRRELNPAVELSAYRIAQEAMTNTLKHEPGSAVHMRVCYEEDAVAIDVVDNGPGMVNGRPHGHGLIGMRERAELFGGTFEARSSPDGGFGVRARLPLTAAVE
jgi:signal transduction histidine kinase